MNALIITDGTDSVHSIAQMIKQAMSGYKINICTAQQFKGTDLLPANLFFIGCENAKPSSFTYLEKMLKHINLASRKCGIFTIKEKTVNYLLKILNDCEAEVGQPLIVSNHDIKKTEINKWIKEVLK